MSDDGDSTSRPTGGFQSVDWDELDDGRRLDGLVVARLLPFAVLAAVYLYDRFADNGALAFGWYPTNLDWLTLFALVVFLVGFVWPIARRPALAARTWRRLRSNRVALLALGTIACFALVALVQPVLVGRPDVTLPHKYQPPVYTTADTYPCISGEDIQHCAGTWQHPLGTNRIGIDMVAALAASINVSMRLALVVSSLAVPLAVLVGTVAGYVGGRVDGVLMRYVDLQQTVPAFLVYIIVGYLTRYTLFNIVVVFGLFSWGSVARLVRSEVLQRKQAAYVTAARNAGASHYWVVRRHVLPNVSGTVLTGMTLQIPTLVLAEAALSFLAFGDLDRMSFGTLIRQGLGIAAWNPGVVHVSASAGPLVSRWWVSVFPVITLVVLVVAFNLLGDELRDALDPRGGA